MESTFITPLQSKHPLPNAYDYDSPLNGIVRYELENLNLITLAHYHRINHHSQHPIQPPPFASNIYQTINTPPSIFNFHRDSLNSRINSTKDARTKPSLSPNYSSSYYSHTSTPFQPFQPPFHALQPHSRSDTIMPFRLEYLRKLDGTTEVKLITTGQLDREFMDKYNLRLVAYDRGGKSGFIEVVINILDANDHKPVFERPNYRASISELSLINTPILTFRASDLDDGDNSLLSYHLSSQSKLNYPFLSRVFKLNSYTGDLSLAGQLDYEKTSVYRCLRKLFFCYHNFLNFSFDLFLFNFDFIDF